MSNQPQPQNLPTTKNMNSGSGAVDRVAKSSNYILKPHYSTGGHATCTNPKCRSRIAKSNATMDLSERLYKALMITNRTKIFIVEGAVVAECVCGNKYDMGGIFFEKNLK